MEDKKLFGNLLINIIKTGYYDITIHGLPNALLIKVIYIKLNTIVYFFLLSEEISRQLTDSQADAIIGTVTNIKTLREACNLSKRNIKIICLRTGVEDSNPEGTIDFNELIEFKGE